MQNTTESASELAAYFLCESPGVRPGQTCERDFIRMATEVALIFVYIFLGFISVVFLVYVINYQEIKKTVSKWFVDASGVSDFPATTPISKANV